MTCGFDGATASAPIDAIGWPSNSGTHVTPAFSVFHTPPSTAPKKYVVPSPGTPDTATVRPPRNGPIDLHCKPLNISGGTPWEFAVMLNVCTVKRKTSTKEARRTIESIRSKFPHTCRLGSIRLHFPMLEVRPGETLTWWIGGRASL